VAQFSVKCKPFNIAMAQQDMALNGESSGGVFTGPAGSIIESRRRFGYIQALCSFCRSPYSITYHQTAAPACTILKLRNLTITALPVAYSVTGTGSYCQGSGGLTIGLFDSDPGVNLQLYKNGLSMVHFVPGSGNALTWPAENGRYLTLLKLLSL